MNKPQDDKPKVEYTSTGVLRVSARELLHSTKGQKELQKAATFAKQNDLQRKPQR